MIISFNMNCNVDHYNWNKEVPNDYSFDALLNDIENWSYNIALHKAFLRTIITKERNPKHYFEKLSIALDTFVNLQRWLIWDHYIIRVEKSIQYVYELMFYISETFDNNLIPWFGMDTISNKDLVERYKNARYDKEKIAILRRLFPIKDNREVLISRETDYMWWMPSGKAIIEWSTYIINIDNFRPWNYASYGLLHEYLHLFLENAWITIKLNSKNQKHRVYFYLLRNLVNDILIERIITENFWHYFASISVDLRKYTNDRIASNDSLQTALTALTWAISNKFNFQNYPHLSDQFDDYRDINKRIQDVLLAFHMRIETWLKYKNWEFIDYEWTSIDIMWEFLGLSNTLLKIKWFDTLIAKEKLDEIIKDYYKKFLESVKTEWERFLSFSSNNKSKKDFFDSFYQALKAKKPENQSSKLVAKIVEIFDGIPLPRNFEEYFGLLSRVDECITWSGLESEDGEGVRFTDDSRVDESLSKFTIDTVDVLGIRNRISEIIWLENQEISDEDILVRLKRSLIENHPDHARDNYNKDLYFEIFNLYLRFKKLLW